MDRRQFALGAGGIMAVPAVLRAQGAPWAGALETARGLSQLHSLSISRNGTVVLAERFAGPALSQLVNVKSVSKTLVSAVLGAAVDRDLVTLESTLGTVAPDLIPAGADRRVADLTLRDLATMRAGLERTSGANYGGWVASGNWVANALLRPFVAEPGQRMLYSTGSYHVLGAALARASGMSLLAMMRAWIGGPLGIEVPGWTRDPQGFYLGGNQMAMTPAAMLRFGELYRGNGVLDGTRVLSEQWVATSLRLATRSPFSGLGYGIGWFLGQARGVDYALARGYGGQVIFVAPSVGISVAITSDPTLPARSGGYFGDLLALLERDVLGAVA